MSRIGKKPIPLPKGVTVKIEGNTVAVQGPKGKLDTVVPRGIKVEQQDGHLVAVRENDSQAALHGLTRALVNNAVEGVTFGNEGVIASLRAQRSDIIRKLAEMQPLPSQHEVARRPEAIRAEEGLRAIAERPRNGARP